ncbi:MAG: hypothetical protein LBQ66_08325 [Planctomycetaceae bacterium]|jgi:hypothetical protein|nr:hypothetical protein [Planctomycetaceae bacterium]
MDKNIYIELELFLDPAITDSVALKKDLEQKIGDWNKMFNADPKYKIRVSTAKKFINEELAGANLKKLAEEARNERLQKLQHDIAELKLLDDEIDEDGLKHLKTSFKNFFTEDTIKSEAGGPLEFVPPTCPPSLECKKIASIVEMRSVSFDLKIVKNGQYKNLYDFLELSPSSPVHLLYEKAKSESERIRRITSKTSEVDAQNRLAGKALNYFKNEESKEGYDKALKRLPFDNLCDEKFKLRARKKEITWKIYQMSINDTLSCDAGLTQEEAEWLVYDYFCNKLKCPNPKPEKDELTEPQTITQPKTQTSTSQQPSSTPPISIPLPPINIPNLNDIKETTQKVGGKIINFVKDFIQHPPAPPEPLGEHKVETQQDFDGNNVLSDFQIIRKRYHSNSNHSETSLRSMFDGLDSLVTMQQMNPTSMLSDMLELRAKIAAKLAEIDYKKERFDFALRYYHAVLEHNPRDKTASTRHKLIDNMKTDMFSELETLLAGGNKIDCLPIVEKLKSGFKTDPETIDFLYKIEGRLNNTKISPQQIQNLINAKKWQTIIRLLDMLPNLDPPYLEVLQKAKQNIRQADELAIKIHDAISQGNLTFASQQLTKLSLFISDYTETESLREDIELAGNNFSGLLNDIKSNCDHKHWIQSENIIRQFLADHPIQASGLMTWVQHISSGTTQYYNKLQFSLFSLFGGILFLLITGFICGLFYPKGTNEATVVDVFVSLGTEFVVLLFGLGFLLRIIGKRSELTKAMRITGIIPLYIFAAIFVSLYVGNDVIEEYLRKLTLERENKPLEDVPLFYAVHYFLPFLTGAFGIGLVQCYLHSFIRRSIVTEKVSMSPHVMWLAPVLSIWFVVIKLPNLQSSLGNYTAIFSHPSVSFGLIWITSCLLVWIDNRDKLDVPFLPNFIGSLQRWLLLLKLKQGDFGKSSLLETNWYYSVEKKTNSERQEIERRKAAQQAAAKPAHTQNVNTTPPPTPAKKVPIPPIQPNTKKSPPPPK